MIRACALMWKQGLRPPPKIIVSKAIMTRVRRPEAARKRALRSETTALRRPLRELEMEVSRHILGRHSQD